MGHVCVTVETATSPSPASRPGPCAAPFYPDGSYLGQPAAAAIATIGAGAGADAAGEGAPDDVLAWVAAAARGPSMSHFASYGRVDPSRPADAHQVPA